MQAKPVNELDPIKPLRPSNDKAEQILDGALKIFTTQGYAAASMDRIAKAAGVSKPTLYSYFQDKEGLFMALVQNLSQSCDPLFPHRPAIADVDLPPEMFLRQLADKALTGFAQNPALLTLIRLIIGESERFPTLAQSFVREIQKPMLENLATYFGSQPQLHFPDPMVAARIFAGSLVHFLIVQKLMQGEDILPLESDRLADGLVALMMAAGKKPNV
ncbi:TetR/AcrR family transcriptional regulator [Synechocystis sp. PCC 7339]|uniref:TetR/AcrR family transcriptional regulator n=1 Tax=Synechocystis sp. PCC 7339 TaxID=2782213 RepID=UPI001CC0C7F1|nr:TetR/AcrR family transcriptional regulator [Synechocystis sp. PCC 7339]UAJ71920.1 TetR/AcrR family transcriptional regulator [Synechocystis sp. PCC 7339]